MNRLLALAVVGVLASPLWAHPSIKRPSESDRPVARPAPRDLPLEGAVLKTLAEYRSALEARDLRRLAELFDRNVIVIDGLDEMTGWDDYLVRRLGPETRSWKRLRFEDLKITRVLPMGDHALASQEAVCRIELADKTIMLRIAETIILSKTATAWKIEHLHRSSRMLEAAP